ncbi:MAG: recombinase family protein [Actinomycetota bacterium]|nr:recombinase family protein [Actinomycetota bacterium]
MFAIYVRVSEVGEREGESFGSPNEQEAKARAWAERNGVEVEEPTIELDVSGATRVSERKLGHLIERCERGELEGIIVRYEDRFARDLIEGGVALDRLVECGTRLVASESGFDSANITPDKRMVFNILMSVGQAQREKNRLARIAGAQRAAERGLHLAARCPIGYRWVDRQKGGRTPTEGGGIGRLEPDPKMAPRVKDAFERRANGESFEKIAARLGLAGKSSARAMIHNRVYLGEATIPTEKRGETKTITGAHDPLVTPELWERANVGRGSWVPRSGKWSALVQLGGIARCAGCGRPLSAGSIRGERAYYSCTAEGCTQRTGIRADRLEAYVSDVLYRAIVVDEVPEVIAIMEGDDRYQRGLEAVEKARAEIDAYRDGVSISDVPGGVDAWKKGLAARQAALDLARQELRKTPSTRRRYSTPLPVSEQEWAAMKPPKPADMSDDEWNALAPERRDEYREKSRRYQIITAAMERDRFARFVDRVIVKPCGRGKQVPTRERAEVWFVGAEQAAPPLPEPEPLGVAA